MIRQYPLRPRVTGAPRHRAVTGGGIRAILAGPVCPTARTLDRGEGSNEAPPHLVRETTEARLAPLDPALVEINFQGRPEGTARLVDPVVNGQFPSTKSSKADPEPTNINFVDLLIKKKDEEE